MELLQHNVRSLLRYRRRTPLTRYSFVLFLFYYPRDQKFIRSLPLEPSSIPTRSLPSFFSFFRTSTPPGLIRRDSVTSVGSGVSDGGTSNSSFDPRSFPMPGAIARSSTVILSPEYRLALSLFVLTMAHLILSAVMTFVLLLTLPRSYNSDLPGEMGKEHPSERAVRVWALTLGLSSAALGIGQYWPQIILTGRTRLVGSLSIPMMLLQVRTRSHRALC